MNTLRFAIPAGYRVNATEPQAMVECERGCGWRLSVRTLSDLPDAARDQLFRCHEEWHAKR